MMRAADILEVWRAGRSRRWHMNADLSRTDDFLDGHGARVARIVLCLVPDARREVVIAALNHDDGEHKIGDISRPAKDALGLVEARRLEEAEAGVRAALWGRDPIAALSAAELELLALADRLDAFLWVRAHAPEILGRSAWRADAAVLIDRAARLGFAREIAPLVRPVRRTATLRIAISRLRDVILRRTRRKERANAIEAFHARDRACQDRPPPPAPTRPIKTI